MALFGEVMQKISGAFEDFGLAESLLSVMFSHPFDTIKVRLQTVGQIDFGGGEYLYCGPLDCFLKIVRREGFLSLYKGMSLPLVSSLPINYITLQVYESISAKFTSDGQKMDKKEVLLDGAISGGLPAILVSPIERVKSLLQIPHGYYTVIRTPLNVAEHIYQTEGIKGFYRGTLLTMIRDSVSTAILFLSYYWLKFNYVKDNPLFMDKSNEERNEHLQYLITGITGGISGMLATLAVIPVDFFKTRHQFRTDSWEELKHDLRMEAQRRHTSVLRFSYTGTPLILFKSFVQHALTFICLELYKDLKRKAYIMQEKGQDVDEKTLKKEIKAMEDKEASQYKL